MVVAAIAGAAAVAAAAAAAAVAAGSAVAVTAAAATAARPGRTVAVAAMPASAANQAGFPLCGGFAAASRGRRRLRMRLVKATCRGTSTWMPAVPRHRQPTPGGVAAVDRRYRDPASQAACFGDVQELAPAISLLWAHRTVGVARGVPRSLPPLLPPPLPPKPPPARFLAPPRSTHCCGGGWSRRVSTSPPLSPLRHRQSMRRRYPRHSPRTPATGSGGTTGAAPAASTPLSRGRPLRPRTRTSGRATSSISYCRHPYLPASGGGGGER